MLIYVQSSNIRRIKGNDLIIFIINQLSFKKKNDLATVHAMLQEAGVTIGRDN